MRIVVISLFLVLAAFWWWQRPLKHPHGVVVSKEPAQILLEDQGLVTQREGFSLRPIAAYVIEGRVLHTKHYLTDPVHKLSPYDVGLGWGKMSDSAILERLKISQSNRFLFWKWEQKAPLSIKEIETHASNNHLIAANANIAYQIAWLREGELIRLEGSLIEATGPDGRKWTSSLRRDDTGNGACEIIWVSKLTKF